MTQDELKLSVAKAALNYLLPKLQSHDILGIGTGSTANFFIDLLAAHTFEFAGAVASSEASAQRLRDHGITVFDLNNVDEISMYIDGADESNRMLHLIKGGGAALTREKIVASCAHEFICIADESKLVKTLGAFPLPVEVIPMARNSVTKQLQDLGGRPVFRKGVVTDNGCDILDVHDLHIDDALSMETAINQIVGVVSNGLFAHRPADILFLGTPDGVRTLSASDF